MQLPELFLPSDYIVLTLSSYAHTHMQSEIVVPLFGRVPLIPRHTIILDRSMCSGSLTPPPPTVSTLPPVISIPPPSSNASETCVALYGIAIDAASEPFLCGLNRDCDELNCRLDILSTHYDIDISVKSCDSPPSILIAISDASGYFQGTVNLEDSTTFSVGIPEPNGTSVTVIIEEIDSAVRLKVRQTALFHLVVSRQFYKYIMYAAVKTMHAQIIM